MCKCTADYRHVCPVCDDYGYYHSEETDNANEPCYECLQRGCATHRAAAELVREHKRLCADPGRYVPPNGHRHILHCDCSLAGQWYDLVHMTDHETAHLV